MRQRQIRQIKQGIHLLGQAHRELKNQLEKHILDAAGNLLKQCQQYAIELGQMIEAEEGEGTEAVSILEDYCEEIYQIYQDMGRLCQPGCPGKAYKRLRQLLIRLENEIRNHIPVRREVVFLPYKASMWDSLESIWRAASNDPDCDAYVIPIPYYDKNPDGSFKEMHYEGNIYPEDVPTTDYRVYDFANRCPDMIFIHNPYDECNYVTSVHPFFYAKNLKQYTEQLIYVPYFILGEPDPDHEDAVEHISHFCTCPGVIYADKVIVQSEAMRQVYIDVLMKFMAGHGYERKDLGKKILGLGSPKVDRVLSLRKEDLEIPDEWKKKIQKADGSWKKIVLYNTSVNAFLQHSEKMLKKIEEVLKIFRDKKEEIVLLWRPHPLMQATVKSMRPQLWEGYEMLTKQYKEEDWGIYDDTVDLERAVLLCDAYYGDPSSVVELCRNVGKMVLIQNTEIIISKQENTIWEKPLVSENLYDDGEDLWFTEFDYNALFKINKRKGKPELVGIFPEENLMHERLYVSAVICGKKLYFAPYNADEIAVYSPETKKFQKIAVPMPRKKSCFSWEKMKFSNVVSIKDKLYFIPDRYPGILCCDIKTGLHICFDDWIDEIERIRVSEWGYFIDYLWNGNELVLPCACADAIVIFNVQTKTTRIIRTPGTNYECRYCGICRMNGYYYLLSADGTISKRKLDAEEEEIKIIRLPLSDSSMAEFHPMQEVDGTIYLFPFEKNKGFKIDTQTDQVLPERMLDAKTVAEESSVKFLTCISREKRLYAVMGNTRCFVEYDLESESQKETVYFLSEKNQEDFKRKRRSLFTEKARQEYLTENIMDSLMYLLDVLQDCNELQEKEIADRAVQYGYKIYDSLIKEF